MQFPQGILLVALCALSPMRAQETGKMPPEARASSKDKACDLADLVNLALENNTQTRIAWHNAVAAAAAAGEARAPYFPRLAVQMRGGVDQGYTPAATGPDNFVRVQEAPAVLLEYLLIDFGRRDADLQRTLQAFRAMSLRYDRQLQRTVFEVQEAYYRHNAALWQEKAALVNLELALVVEAAIIDRMKAGLATQPEALLAKRTLTHAQYDVEAARGAVKTSLGRLRTVAGLAANAPLAVQPLPQIVSFAPLNDKLDAMIDAALKSRPDLASRVADLRASEEAARRARADFLPTVRLEASYENESFAYRAEEQNGRQGGTFQENRNNYGAFLVADWDLFDGFERVERLKRRKAEEEGSRVAVEREQLDATLDVWTSYYNTRTARRRVDFAESLLKSSQENFDAANASFREGLATIMELVASQNALSAARFERASADADYLTSTASLAFAMGLNLSGRVTPDEAPGSGERGGPSKRD